MLNIAQCIQFHAKNKIRVFSHVFLYRMQVILAYIGKKWHFAVQNEVNNRTMQNNLTGIYFFAWNCKRGSQPYSKCSIVA